MTVSDAVEVFFFLKFFFFFLAYKLFRWHKCFAQFQKSLLSIIK